MVMRDPKGGFSIPILKLEKSNKVLISQNLIRWAAIIDRPDKPHYAKKIRTEI